MTQAQARSRVRRLLDQTDSNETQFTDTFIDEMVNLARRTLASILPEKRFPKLRAGEERGLKVNRGLAAYPPDFLKRLRHKEVIIDGVYAAEIPEEEIWRLKFLENNALTQSGAKVKYYRETGAGIKAYPASAREIFYPYLKVPGVLGSRNNTDLPKDVEDLSIDYAFERLMNTQRGDLELAISLAKDKGFRVEGTIRNT